ncbi:putative subtilisin-like serine protease [Rosellinia necatrix]|uniref:Putative subtilisin-like serine protease n=1 Tax=Rosellinia necatrix TaxID=77044 RepID=A0A1W2TR33_ROSNE|nr:putative subtilisin-like serine protease [Rosellinia necatrix]
MTFPLFTSTRELNKELLLAPAQADAANALGIITRIIHLAAGQNGPAARAPRQTLPGQPQVALDNNANLTQVKAFLTKEFSTRGLERILFPLLTIPSHKSIHPFTYQVVRGLDIIITEEPRLHLVWGYGQIFIKPIPRYLLSHAFWMHYLAPTNSPLSDDGRQRIRQYALGFMRTYYYLIQHESDFRLAQDEKLRLVPEGIQWEDFYDFILGFANIPNTETIPNRFHYSQVSLFRLNIWYYVHHPFAYKGFQSVERKWSYRAQFFLFAFATASVITGAMQTAASVQQLIPAPGWPHLWKFWINVQGFSIATISLFAGVAGVGLLLQIWKLLRQGLYTIKRLMFPT